MDFLGGAEDGRFYFLKNPRGEMKAALGLDFGTESVRAVLVDLRGREAGLRRWRSIRTGRSSSRSPARRRSCRRTTRCSIRTTGSTPPRRPPAPRCGRRSDARRCIGIGVDFTSCTMLPAMRDGTPLCLLKAFAAEPLAWPKLWKHHGAQAQTDRINAVAREARRRVFSLATAGSSGSSGFFRKCSRRSSTRRASTTPRRCGSKRAIGSCGSSSAVAAESLPRSTCQAGYKGMWSATDGYPAEDFLRAVNPKFARVVQDKMPGRLLAPGVARGRTHSGDGEEVRPARRHAGQRGDHRRARRRARRGCGGAGHARHGDGHQLLPHAEQRSGAHRPRRRGRREGRHPARLLRLRDRPGRRRRRLRLAAQAHRPARFHHARSRSRRAAAGRGWRALRRLVQRLPHAAHGWFACTAPSPDSRCITRRRIFTARCSRHRRSACAGSSSCSARTACR